MTFSAVTHALGLIFWLDGYARDVTLRYTKNFGAKTSKLRPPQKKDEPDWWTEIMGFMQRPQRLVSLASPRGKTCSMETRTMTDRLETGRT